VNGIPLLNYQDCDGPGHFEQWLLDHPERKKGMKEIEENIYKLEIGSKQ